MARGQIRPRAVGTRRGAPPRRVEVHERIITPIVTPVKEVPVTPIITPVVTPEVKEERKRRPKTHPGGLGPRVARAVKISSVHPVTCRKHRL